MARFLALLLIIANGGRLCSQSAPAASTGLICIAAVEPPNGGEKSLANPAGGNRIRHYSIRIDNLPLVHTVPEKGFRTEALDYSKKHLVRIFGDGKQVESFYFRFADFDSNDLCLFFSPLYQTWQLWEMKRTGKWCACNNAK